MRSHQEILNPRQQEAVNHVEGPVLVLAGAGSGKTRVVTFRIAHLLDMGVPASEILAVTFTNKAAEEMRHRIHKMAGVYVLTCTFHSLCARILRESITALGYTKDFVIYDADDSEKLLKECFSGEKAELKTIKFEISQAKNNLTEITDDPITREVYKLYQEKLKAYNAVDFDDLLFLTVRLFKEHPDILESYQKRFSFILIDEYQDTNAAQYTLIKLLANHNNVFAVGDPDQSIYSWRGANIQNILNFEKDYPGAKIIPLEQNYRSTNTILRAANALISRNIGRKEKDLWSELGNGEKIGFYICDHEKQEAEFVVKRIKHHQIPLKECAIFYRTNFQSRVFEDALLKEGTPYTIIGGLSFYQRKEIKDILAYLRMLVGGFDFLAFARSINLPKRGIGPSSLEKIQKASEENNIDIFTAASEIPLSLPPKAKAGLQEYVELILRLRRMKDLPLHELIEKLLEESRYLEYLKEDPETCAERRENLQELVSKAAETENVTLTSFLEELTLKGSTDVIVGETVNLMTFHHGKGLEFKLVFLVGMEEDLFPHMNSIDSPEGLEEERRLCYVGMTRAKEYLYLTASRVRFLWGGLRRMRPSRFLSEIPAEFLQAYHYTNHSGTSEEFSVGDTVQHRDFGAGEILKVYNTSLGTTYDIYFESANTTRSLVAKFAKLTKHD